MPHRRLPAVRRRRRSGQARGGANDARAVPIEANGTSLDEQRFPGRQARLVFAYLLAEQGRPIRTDHAASVLIRYAAANGDAISGSYAGIVANVVGDLGFYEQDNVITGGTGRFAGASGQFHLSGIANLATLDSSQQISGTVSSPGSSG
jgi:hypothetical protein